MSIGRVARCSSVYVPRIRKYTRSKYLRNERSMSCQTSRLPSGNLWAGIMGVPSLTSGVVWYHAHYIIVARAWQCFQLFFFDFAESFPFWKEIVCLTIKNIL